VFLWSNVLFFAIVCNFINNTLLLLYRLMIFLVLHICLLVHLCIIPCCISHGIFCDHFLYFLRKFSWMSTYHIYLSISLFHFCSCWLHSFMNYTILGWQLLCLHTSKAQLNAFWLSSLSGSERVMNITLY
jgi:hypothetical protein